jgi:hypothetical protein
MNCPLTTTMQNEDREAREKGLYRTKLGKRVVFMHLPAVIQSFTCPLRWHATRTIAAATHGTQMHHARSEMSPTPSATWHLVSQWRQDPMLHRNPRQHYCSQHLFDLTCPPNHVCNKIVDTLSICSEGMRLLALSKCVQVVRAHVFSLISYLLFTSFVDTSGLFILIDFASIGSWSVPQQPYFETVITYP